MNRIPFYASLLIIMLFATVVCLPVVDSQASIMPPHTVSHASLSQVVTHTYAVYLPFAVSSINVVATPIPTARPTETPPPTALAPETATPVSSPTATATLSVPLNLPDTPYNYANIELPGHFDEVANIDNTPNDNPITDHGATLGRVLFYDVNLSVNNTLSCSSCHVAENGFSDPSPVSTGFDGTQGRRNSMGLANAGFYENGHFFWDERADTLEIQTLLPIQDQTELGMTLEDLVPKLSGLEYYPTLFTNAFGDSGVTSDRISRALAQFVRSMVSTNSRYDIGRAAAGNDDDDFANFSNLENRGKRLFFANRTRCSDCHETVVFVGDQPRNNGLDLVYADNGEGEMTGNVNDNGKFKAPSLRNIELTAPYMHDGRFATLEQVIEHYNSGVQAHDNLDNRLRQGGNGGDPRQLNLSDQDLSALVAFLQTLTDDSFINNEKYLDPFMR